MTEAFARRLTGLAAGLERPHQAAARDLLAGVPDRVRDGLPRAGQAGEPGLCMGGFDGLRHRTGLRDGHPGPQRAGSRRGHRRRPFDRSDHHGQRHLHPLRVDRSCAAGAVPGRGGLRHLPYEPAAALWTSRSAYVLAGVNVAFVPSSFFGNDPADFYAANGWGTTASMGAILSYCLLALGISTYRSATRRKPSAGSPDPRH